MKIICDQCGQFIHDIRVSKDEQSRVTTIEVHHHGEVDSMTLTDEWIQENPMFAMMIDNDMTIGRAFVKKQEDA